MNDATNHQPDVTDPDVTQELAAPEFIDAPENLPGDHSDPTSDDPTSDPRRHSADQVESEHSV